MGKGTIRAWLFDLWEMFCGLSVLAILGAVMYHLPAILESLG